MDEKDLSAVSALLSDFSIRINDLEEKCGLLKERLLVISQTLLKQGERVSKEITLIKEDIRNIKNEIDRLKEATQHIISESAEFARKEELKVLERYMRMFEPLKFVSEDDVKRLIAKALKEKDMIKVRE